MRFHRILAEKVDSTYCNRNNSNINISRFSVKPFGDPRQGTIYNPPRNVGQGTKTT